MKKLFYLAAVLAAAGLIVLACQKAPNPLRSSLPEQTSLDTWPRFALLGNILVGFESLPPGASVEGLGTVHPDLNIHSFDAPAVIIAQGIPGTYGAPNDLLSYGIANTQNGCIGYPGYCASHSCTMDDYINDPPPYGQGFADPDGDLIHHYEFTFSPGTTVEFFAVMVLDYGDYNPTNATYHEVLLTAYNAANEVVYVDSIAFHSSSDVNPRSSDFGDLWYTGDACTATHGLPGFYTLRSLGFGIVRVELTFPYGIDPNVALGNIEFRMGERCTKTIGYWKNHSWEGATVSICGVPIDETLGDEILWAARGKNFSMFFAQLIAAKLNTDNSSGLPFINEAEEWLCEQTTIIIYDADGNAIGLNWNKSFDSKRQKRRASRFWEDLDDFNNEYPCD
jgi:hypothetical protein